MNLPSSPGPPSSLTLLVALVCAEIAAASPDGPAIPKPELTLSHQCGECHREIYRTWRKSAHSRSLEDPVFLDTYRETAERLGTEVAHVCLECHAPLVQVTGDAQLSLQVSWEGVNCDSCHNLIAVDMSGARPRMRLDIGPVKRGPIRDASSMAHEVAYSELHTKSLVCAPCHEYVSPEGTAVMTTYSEWKESGAAAEGKQCQECHMGLRRAHVVDPRIKRTAHAEINVHEVPGGHSLDQLHEALAVSIKPSRAGDEVTVTLRLANRGAGHAVPTGMPGRRVILEVELETSAGGSFHERRTYEKLLADADGQTITRDGDHFARGVQLASDSRIQADETRTEVFRFPVPATATAFITVRLHYEHAPKGTEEDRTRITFLSETRVVRPDAEDGD